jgi:hypothetical protein
MLLFFSYCHVLPPYDLKPGRQGCPSLQHSNPVVASLVVAQSTFYCGRPRGSVALRLGPARGLIAHRAIIQHPRAASLPYDVAVSPSAAVCGTRPISTKPVRARIPGLFIFIIHFPLRFGAIIHFTENPRRMQNFFIHFTVFERIKLTSARGIIYNIFVHFQNGSILTVTNKIFNKYTERHRL